MVLVDSSIWIEALRRHGALEIKVALESLLDIYEAAWCGPIGLEVLGGARKHDRPILLRYFDVIPKLPTDDSIWGEAWELSWHMRDAGESIPWNDLMIAAVALRQGCRIFAQDGHFESMAEHSLIQLYKPGYGGSYREE